MKVHGWCTYHGKMIDKKKFKSHCHKPKQRRCKYFSFQIPKHLESRRKRVEGYGEFRSKYK